MSVAIPIPLLQNLSDVAVSLSVGVDEYALVYDHDTARFVLRAPFSGTPYALLAGRAGGQTLYGGTAANDDITIHGTSDATRTTSYVLLQPTAGKVGIGTATPLQKLHVAGDVVFDGGSASPGQVYLTGSTTPLKRLIIGYDTTSDFGFLQSVYSGSDNTPLLLNPSGGNVGIGTTAPGTLIHGLLTSAATNAVTNVVTIGHDTSGTAAAGFGAGLLIRLESNTTAASPAARLRALWYEATHATRKVDLVLTAYDTAEREGLRIRGDGSAPAIGFLGATPQARILHLADASVAYGVGDLDTEAEVIAAINATNGKINSILATLELFGFHATS